MSNFIGTVLTNEGKKLLGKVLAGEKLTLTKVCVGDGDVAEADIKDLKDIASYNCTSRRWDRKSVCIQKNDRGRFFSGRKSTILTGRNI